MLLKEEKDIDYQVLIGEALKIRENAYVPYSRLRVGAALLAEDGTIITGINIENVSYGATCCAERTAIFSAIARGINKFSALAVVSDMDKPIFPCGICLQVIAEFQIPTVIVGDRNGNYIEYSARELIPHAFTEFNTK